MDIFNSIGSGISIGSTMGGYAAALTHRSAVVGTAIGGLVGAGCGLIIWTGRTLLSVPRQLARN